jgi:phytol kinase
MSNIIGIIMSFGFIFLVIILSSILSKRKLLGTEGSRKFIHIGVSNWWIIAMIFFDNILAASIVPVAFIIINFVSYKFNLIKAMERNESKNDLGTVYFPISLLILVILSFSSYSAPYVGALGILIMGYGDGLAAVIGKRIKSPKFYIMGNKKSISGCITMFAASFIISAVIIWIYSPAYLLIKALSIALFAAVIEGATPYGLDNLTVPILSSILYQILFF